MTCHFRNHIQSKKTLCVRDDLTQITFEQFWQDVHTQSAIIEKLEQQTWALWEKDSYDFLVLLFAALWANKKIVIAPYRVKDLDVELEQQGISFLTRSLISPVAPKTDAQQRQALNLDCTSKLDDSFLEQSQVYFYTSGSTGQPKQIPRTLKQLLNEVQGLHQSFVLDDDAIALATVSHQHIYGLLFKLLLPLATGRSFYLSQLPFPEDVVAVQIKLKMLERNNYVISSPALLKRWTTDIILQDCMQIYSSGGKLDSDIRPLLNSAITEVLGSSETGGIAHRQQDHALWMPFANVSIQVDHEALAIKSNHALSQDWIFTGDRAEVVEPNNPQSPFQLLGRIDRIIKLEEKRLSLDAIEQKIISLEAIQQCHTLLIDHEQRQILACVAVLKKEARQTLQEIGKAQFIRMLKMQLKEKLEPIAIPRQWRFLSQLPQNTQSKLNKQDIQGLFKAMLFPIVLEQQSHLQQVNYQLEFPPELACFKGHFLNNPIYPGVGQIGFVQHFAKQVWGDLAWCNGYEQLKFQDLIRPYSVLELKLERHKHKVMFEIRSPDKIMASGRLLFASSNNTEI